jgi:hypothetical protein
MKKQGQGRGEGKGMYGKHRVCWPPDIKDRVGEGQEGRLFTSHTSFDQVAHAGLVPPTTQLVIDNV